jgi:hypothetical protein
VCLTILAVMPGAGNDDDDDDDINLRPADSVAIASNA